MSETQEAAEKAAETEDKRVALLISFLALFLALSEAGAKYAEHHSTEKNIESSDLYNFYQAKRIRSTVIETATQSLEATVAAIADDKAREAAEKQIGGWKQTVARFEKDDKNPADSLDRIIDRAKEAAEARELSNKKLEHFEYAAGLLQIAIVLSSASIVTGIVALAFGAGVLGVIGAVLSGFGFFAPTALSFIG